MVNLHTSVNFSIEMNELQQLCQHTLQDFNLCMFYEPHHQVKQKDLKGGGESFHGEDDGEEFVDPGDPGSFQYLDNGIVFKIFGCLICTVHLLEKSGELFFCFFNFFPFIDGDEQFLCVCKLCYMPFPPYLLYVEELIVL